MTIKLATQAVMFIYFAWRNSVILRPYRYKPTWLIPLRGNNKFTCFYYGFENDKIDNFFSKLLAYILV